MCEDIYSTAGDVDACANGCNTTLGSQLPSYITISLDLVSVLSMMDSVANQAYNMAFSTTSEISVITVFTSEEVPHVSVFICSKLSSSVSRTSVNGKWCSTLLMVSVL